MSILAAITVVAIAPILLFIGMAVRIVRPRPVATILIFFAIVSIALIFGLASWAAAGGRA